MKVEDYERGQKVLCMEKAKEGQQKVWEGTVTGEGEKKGREGL